MIRSLHRVLVDVYNVPYRGCRPYQEKISSYAMSAKPIFEWDQMRQYFYMNNIPRILTICEPCPMNIFGGVEGCEGDLEGLTQFLKATLSFRPDSLLFKYRYQDDLLTHDETRQYVAELHAIQELLSTLEWPVAQVFEDGEPRPSDGMHGIELFEWDGEEEIETFILSNEGYTVGLNQQGIVVRDCTGTRAPYQLKWLKRERSIVTGETTTGEAVQFDPLRDATPAWDNDPAYVDAELVFTRMPAAEIFREVLLVLTTVAEIAVQHNTGMRIKRIQ